MGGSGGGASTINENPLPDWAQTQVQTYLSRANTLSEDPYVQYSGATYAVRNSNEIAGIAALAARARDGSPIISLGSELLITTLQGGKLSGYSGKNTEWATRAEEAYEEFIDITIPAIDTAVNNIGGFGGSGHIKRKIIAARSLFKTLAGFAFEIFGEDYFNERKFMNDGLTRAEGFAAASIADIEALRMAGLYEREYQQGLLEDAYRLWTAEQEQQVKRLEIMGNAIRAMLGSNVTKTTPYYRPGEMAQIAGVALTGMSAIGRIYGTLNNPSVIPTQPAAVSQTSPNVATPASPNVPATTGEWT